MKKRNMKQRNVEVNTYYYNKEELKEIGLKYGFYLKYDVDILNKEVPRIDLDFVKKLDIVVDSYGFLTTVATMEDGYKIYVLL